jgi:hypothetical protein
MSTIEIYFTVGVLCSKSISLKKAKSTMLKINESNIPSFNHSFNSNLSHEETIN